VLINNNNNNNNNDNNNNKVPAGAAVGLATLAPLPASGCKFSNHEYYRIMADVWHIRDGNYE
jgi:hypothetical protein